MQVVDLFCGLGGFSAGAINAGATVILGADQDSVPLKLWAANVPSGRAKLVTLGKDRDVIELPQPSPSLHIHASPPCTDLSSARNGAATAADVEGGVLMMRWALDLVLERGDHSWSIENVSTPTTRSLLAEYADRFPDWVGYATLNASDFGASQTRIRLIAAPPKLIQLLLEMPSAHRVSVREAFANHGLGAPASHFKNQTRNRDGTACMRSIEEQSFTVCASRECHEVPNLNPLILTCLLRSVRSNVDYRRRFDMVWSRGPDSQGNDRARVRHSHGLWADVADSKGQPQRATRGGQCAVRGHVHSDHAGCHRSVHRQTDLNNTADAHTITRADEAGSRATTTREVGAWLAQAASNHRGAHPWPTRRLPLAPNSPARRLSGTDFAVSSGWYCGRRGGTLGAEPVALLIRASQRRAVAKVMVRSATLFAHADRAFVIVTATDYAAPRGIVVNTEAWTTRRHTPVCARTKDSQNIAFPCV